MELRVHLKVCESCGCFWYRGQEEESVYCTECKTRLQEFPPPESRKRRGRPAKQVVARIWAVAEAALGDSALNGAAMAEGAMAGASGGAK